jgi:ATP-dependent Clp endopeptidase proteolytic subunit ClpP
MSKANCWYSIVNKAADDSAEVMIYDVIGAWGIGAERFVNDLNGITAKNIKVRMNTPGGDVFDGVAIHNAIKEHPATITVCVEGLAASIGSVIAMAGDEVCMGKNAFMMIHNPQSMAFGDADDLKKTADLLDKICNTLAQTYADKSGKTVEEMKAAMDAETWYTAGEAKAAGLCDSIVDDDDEDAPTARATASFDYQVLAHSPDRLRRFVAARIQETNSKPPTPRGAANPVPINQESAMDLAQFKAFAEKNPDALAPLVSAAVATAVAAATTQIRAEAGNKPATAAELKAAFPSHSGFIVDQLGANATLIQARAAFADVVANENKDLKAKVEKLEKDLAAADPDFDGVTTALEGQPRNGGAGGGSVQARFEAAVKLKTDKGISRAKAVSQISVENKGLLDEYAEAEKQRATAFKRGRVEAAASY